MSFGLVDSLRVEAYLSAPIIITKIEIVGANVEVTFTGPPEAAPADFKLLGSGTVNDVYTDESASPSSLGTGIFKATKTLGTAPKFYRIKYSPELIIAM